MQPSYYSVIPAPVRYSSVLSANAKLLFSEITALASKEGYCWASNQYFAELYGVSPTTVSEWVSQLKEGGFVHTEVQQDRGNERKIWIAIPFKPKRSSEKDEEGSSGKAEESITSISNKKNTPAQSAGYVVVDDREAPKKAAKSANAEYEDGLQWAEKRRGFKFVNRVKQYAALKKAEQNGISVGQLTKRWKKLEGDPFYDDRGFDWTTVVNSFDKSYE